jgi:hypothetical protein
VISKWLASTTAELSIGPNYLVLGSINFLQINTDGEFAWFFGCNIAYPMRGQVGMAILVVRDLVFPAHSSPD